MAIYEGVLLDWDDLLVETRVREYQRLRAMGERFFNYSPTDEELDEVWGTGVENEWPCACGNPPGVTLDDYSSMIDSIPPDFPYPKQHNPGAVELVAGIAAANRVLGIVSSYRSDRLIRVMEGIGHVSRTSFSFIHGADLTGVKKPDPGVFAQAIELLADRDIGTETTAYVGDDLEKDGVSAHAAGLGFLGVALDRFSVDQFESAGYRAVNDLHQARVALLDASPPELHPYQGSGLATRMTLPERASD